MKTLQFERTGYDLVVVKEIDDPGEIDAAVASATLRLLSKAYGNQLERPQGDLAPGTFNWYFGPDNPTKVSRHRELMSRHISRGSVYWIVPEHGTDLRSQKALVKTTPSRDTSRQKLRLETPNCYLNDIIVDPARQRQGIGSTVLLAALASGRFDTRRSLALDTYQNNEGPNKWFRQLGMHAVTAEVEPLVVRQEPGIILHRIRYSSEGQATLGDITARLETSSGAVL